MLIKPRAVLVVPARAPLEWRHTLPMDCQSPDGLQLPTPHPTARHLSRERSKGSDPSRAAGSQRLAPDSPTFVHSLQ